MSVTLTINCPAFCTSVNAEVIVCTAISQAGFNLSYSIDVIFDDDLAVQALNKTHRGKDKPTNVLSLSLIHI